MASSAAAKSQLAAMLTGGNLREISAIYGTVEGIGPGGLPILQRFLCLVPVLVQQIMGIVVSCSPMERMEQDPAYAQEIFAKIDTWFAFDVARNEAIMPGSTWDMSQAVAIGNQKIAPPPQTWACVIARTVSVGIPAISLPKISRRFPLFSIAASWDFASLLPDNYG